MTDYINSDHIIWISVLNAPRHYGHDGDTSLSADANRRDNDHDEEASDDEVTNFNNY